MRELFPFPAFSQRVCANWAFLHPCVLEQVSPVKASEPGHFFVGKFLITNPVPLIKGHSDFYPISLASVSFVS